MRRPFLLAIIVIIALIGAGAYYLTQGETDSDSDTPEQRPAFTLPDLDGDDRAISEWDGDVIMLNFWASWCPPCRREIPAFIELQEDFGEQGFQVIGVAIDDRQAVIDFTDPMGVNYPLLLGTRDGIEIAEAYGNDIGVLPYTVFIDRGGRVVETHRSELDYEEVEAIIEPLL
ncbi:MAG: TlpA family protein disulfide reductase [Pseudomonadota bacterium]